jgi:FkbM family methyltransferase
MFKDIIKKVLPKKIIDTLGRIKYNYFCGYGSISYAQEGEDMILRRIFEGQMEGFYVDVGAHHPKRFSNTYLFYKMGWRGINIDAMPSSMKLFNRVRPRDINIEKPISDKKEILTYYSFNEPALNGFSKELSEKRDGLRSYFIKETIKIETTTLSKILEEKLPQGQNIDFLSIDVEGLDFDVLRSNNFEKYRPKIILIEILENSMQGIQDHEVTQYLRQYNYSIFAKAMNTVIFMDDNFYKKNFIR